MTTLALQQRGLLALLKQRPADVTNDPWLRQVQGSFQLEMLREIALWWRCFQISAQCRYTARLLKQFGCFEAAVGEFFNGRPTSAYIENLSRDFLAFLDGHCHPLVRAVAATESAFELLRSQQAGNVTVVWDRNPDDVFSALDHGQSVPPAVPDESYRLRIGNAIPGLVQCRRVRMRNSN